MSTFAVIFGWFPLTTSVEEQSPPTLSKMRKVESLFFIILVLGKTRGCVDVSGVTEKVIRLHVDQVGGEVPHILSVIDDANQLVSAREQSPANMREL